jgi:Flp pilus assembly protein TadD
MANHHPRRRIAPVVISCGVPSLLVATLLSCSPINTTAPKIADSTRLSLADIASSGGDVESARTILKAAAEQDPDNTEVQLRYAGALLDAGRPGEASSVAAKALSRHPQDTALALKVGQMQLKAKDAAGAAATFETAAGHGADSVAALNGLGVARVQQGDLESATDSFRRAVTLNPNDFASRNNLALALVLQGRSSEALPMLVSLANEPGSPGRVRHNLALAYAEEGNTREAAAVLADVVGPTAALQEASSLAIVKRSSPASIMNQLAPVELLGPGVPRQNAMSTVSPQALAPQALAPQAVAPNLPAPQSGVPRAAAASQPVQPQVATAPKQGYTATPLPSAPAPKAVTSPDGASLSGPTHVFVASRVEASTSWRETRIPQRLVTMRQPQPQPEAIAHQFAAVTADEPPPEPPAVHSGHVRVRIAAAPTHGAALALWDNLTNREPDLLGDRKPVISRREGGPGGRWRLGASGFQDVSAAENFCRELRARGPECAVGL